MQYFSTLYVNMLSIEYEIVAAIFCKTIAGVYLNPFAAIVFPIGRVPHTTHIHI